MRPEQAAVAVVEVIGAVEVVGVVARMFEVGKVQLCGPSVDETDQRMGRACRAEGSLLGQHDWTTGP